MADDVSQPVRQAPVRPRSPGLHLAVGILNVAIGVLQVVSNRGSYWWLIGVGWLLAGILWLMAWWFGPKFWRGGSAGSDAVQPPAS